jgi:hypothetical protein
MQLAKVTLGTVTDDWFENTFSFSLLFFLVYKCTQGRIKKNGIKSLSKVFKKNGKTLFSKVKSISCIGKHVSKRDLKCLLCTLNFNCFLSLPDNNK